jgi:hypothetical protein
VGVSNGSLQAAISFPVAIPSKAKIQVPPTARVVPLWSAVAEQRAATAFTLLPGLTRNPGAPPANLSHFANQCCKNLTRTFTRNMFNQLT